MYLGMDYLYIHGRGAAGIFTKKFGFLTGDKNLKFEDIKKVCYSSCKIFV